VGEEWSCSGRGREGESLIGISAPLMWMRQLVEEVRLASLGSPPTCHVTQLRRPHWESTSPTRPRTPDMRKHVPDRCYIRKVTLS
jgi:hypothetical protein